MQNQIVNREEWTAARKKLLEAEKAHTRRGDELARMRRELPWVRIDKPYRFATDAGECGLDGLFRGRSQLLIYHFMYGPEYGAPCPSCSSIADGFDGIATHLANHDVMLWAVSRAPLDMLRAFKQRTGWAFPWASSSVSDFNYDFSASFTPEQQRTGIEYNYRPEPPFSPPPGAPDPDALGGIPAQVGTDMATFIRERPGMSAFLLEGGVIYHTYSAYARGLDAMWSMYQWLDRAPKGRNEEEGYWLRHRDKYSADSTDCAACCCKPAQAAP
jgi:predicted dithiol-disulfide oxidoreductase (DUF899 family)